MLYTLFLSVCASFFSLSLSLPFSLSLSSLSLSPPALISFVASLPLPLLSTTRGPVLINTPRLSLNPNPQPPTPQPHSRSPAPLAVRSVASSTRALRTAAPAASLLSDKTGQTGAAVLGGGLAAYLVSKEVIIFHAETVVVAAIGAVTYGIMHKVCAVDGLRLSMRARRGEARRGSTRRGPKK